MNISVNTYGQRLPHETQKLLERMVSPLCGLDRMLVFTLRNRAGARFIVSGAELTGVHTLLNQPEPGSYHIGGGGLVLQEAVIRALGETVERYSQFVSIVGGCHPIKTATFNELRAANEKMTSLEELTFFADEQYSAPGFPFQAFDPESPLGWVKAVSLIDCSDVWIPAQLVLLGYTVQRERGEPWLLSAVTTGTAAHTRPWEALRNALMELVQVDAAVGHWYSSARAPQILFDRRTRPLERVIARHFGTNSPSIRFHWVASPDLVGINVACVIRGAHGQTPAGGVGLGSDLRLLPAMYKALLEAVGVMLLAKLNLVTQALDEVVSDKEVGAVHEEAIYDLDANVNMYADPSKTRLLDEKFTCEEVLKASDLPTDIVLGPLAENALLIDGFRRAGKELVQLDITSRDSRDLGFVTARVWSPGTLSLCLPSAPPRRHPRFHAYGGVSHGDPHPYP